MAGKFGWTFFTCVLVLLGSVGFLGCGPKITPPLPDTGQRLKVSLQVDGRTRRYLLYVPPGYDARSPSPLVVVIHGAFVTASQFERFSGWSTLAERQGFVVLYPNGIGLLGLLQHWNSGHCCGKALRKNVDDVGFLALAIEDAARRYAIDRRRVYMVGHSNGAMLTYRFAAERPAMVAAIAVVAGTIGGAADATTAEWRIPRPEVPVPVLAFHGREDEQVVYDGGRSRRGRSTRTELSVATSMLTWVQANGTHPLPQSERLYGGHVQRDTWHSKRCNAEVVLYTLEGWGHAWPGPVFIQSSARWPMFATFDATAIAWQFFTRHQRTLPCS